MKRMILVGGMVALGLLAVVISVTGAGSQPPPKEEKPKGEKPTRGREVYYTAVIGTKSPDFDDGKENPGILAGKPAGGTLTAWVNGDPVGFYTSGINIWPLAPFVRAGKNELT